MVRDEPTRFFACHGVYRGIENLKAVDGDRHLGYTVMISDGDLKTFWCSG